MAGAAKSVQVTMANDHDLLIVLNTKMDVLGTDVKEMKEGTQRRIDKLENDKIDRTEVMAMKVDAEKVHKDTKDDYETSRKDHEARIRAMEIKIYVASGVVIAVQIGLAIWGAFH